MAIVVRGFHLWRSLAASQGIRDKVPSVGSHGKARVYAIRLIWAGDAWRSKWIHAAVLSDIQGSLRTVTPAAARA